MTGIGGDERRVRQLLHARGIGYAPRGTPEPAPARERDWLDDILDERPDTPPAPAPRLGDWRKGETTDLRGDLPDDAPEPPEIKPEPVDEQLLDDEDDAEGEWADVDEPDTERPVPGRGRRPPAARRAHAEYLDLPARARAALYTGTAAGAGYWAGLAPMMRGWIADCGRDNGQAAGVVLGVGLVLACGVLIDRRTRGWWGPLPWLCRIPLASALLALLLYAPGATS